jgi:hypothetical protein
MPTQQIPDLRNAFTQIKICKYVYKMLGITVMYKYCISTELRPSIIQMQWWLMENTSDGTQSESWMT